MKPWKVEMEPRHVIAALKAIAWEKAKAELRCLVHVADDAWGYKCPPDQRPEYQEWEDIDKRVEAFIKDMEDNGPMG